MHRVQLATAEALQPPLLRRMPGMLCTLYLLVCHSSDVDRLQLGGSLMPDVEWRLCIGQEGVLALQQLLRQEVQEQWVAAWLLLDRVCHHGRLRG